MQSREYFILINYTFIRFSRRFQHLGCVCIKTIIIKKRDEGMQRRVCMRLFYDIWTSRWAGCIHFRLAGWAPHTHSPLSAFIRSHNGALFFICLGQGVNQLSKCSHSTATSRPWCQPGQCLDSEFTSARGSWKSNKTLPAASIQPEQRFSQHQPGLSQTLWLRPQAGSRKVLQFITTLQFPLFVWPLRCFYNFPVAFILHLYTC